ncbi:protein adenylyltransferase SelO [Lysobacter niastensis]|uniref:Protein nucleotidyltransferase YdiU n=1 Tax=Lysobacter niastensis TaxID=380629 RepID=A0ABS0BA12_9GAMM|nr:YdiU family protein [Lysobacter niastensis]MBF6024652.1 YdiU family protein [Lysobacter niastensis]
MLTPDFDNAFIRDLPGDSEAGPGVRQVQAAWSPVEPTPVAAPRLLAYSPEMARTLGFSDADVASPEFAQVFGGNALLPGMQPFAVNYGGHQFGHWAGQLGDGRAITLGEMVNATGERWELQLKGAGLTPYSRSADGRAVLRSSIREFLCSEAMHHLGVPTTRALSLVGTGELVERDMFYDGHPELEPGAVVCRVAPSFLRFGNFELPASRGDVDLLRRLVDFCIRRDYPRLRGEGQALYAEWFAQVCERTALMVSHWMRVGFVHGVMNTDNMSILGLTIDYGPYGWIDNFDPGWTPNTTDRHQRRYRFGQQPQVAYWNLGRLAGALSLVFDGVEDLQEGLRRYVAAYTAADRDQIARKLGLDECRDEDVGLMQALQDLMVDAEIDMTLFFRALADVDPDAPDPNLFADSFYDEAKRETAMPQLQEWLSLYAARLLQQDLPESLRRETMNAANPRYVLRNYLAQQAIDRATQGDLAGVNDLLDVMRRPYEDQPGREAYAARRPDWARSRAGCSMLSCSS